MTRANYIILLLILIVIYVIYFTNILNNVNMNNLFKLKESYSDGNKMSHPNLLFNSVDALKYNNNQPTRDFTGFFTKL